MMGLVKGYINWNIKQETGWKNSLIRFDEMFDESISKQAGAELCQARRLPQAKLTSKQIIDVVFHLR